MAKEKITPEQWAVSRAAWESDPKITHGQIGESLGVSKQAVAKKAKEQGWQKRFNIADVTSRAYQVADGIREEIKPQTRPACAPPVVASEPKSEAPTDLSPFELQQLAEADAVAKRAAVLERHRVETNAPRQMVYSALKANDTERGKLAKIAAETLKILQECERKAWGFDREGEGQKLTVVIDRG